MKKRFLGLIAIIALVLGLSAMFVACGEEEETTTYSVTVVSPDDQPMSGITVSWMQGSDEAGSAKTGADGKATAELPSGTYSIELSGYYEGYEYDPVSVTASNPDVLEMPLRFKRVNYSVTVLDKTDAPVQGVSVTWTSGSTVETATTDANGSAECELNYGSYSVTLADLPEDSAYDGGKTVSGSNPSASFKLRDTIGNMTYKVTVKSEGGLLFKNQSLLVYKGSTQMYAPRTDDNGVAAFAAEPGVYTVRVALTPNGYSYDTLTLTAVDSEKELILKSQIITSDPPANTSYVVGDIFHNYTFTTPYELNGEVWEKTVTEILKEKKVIILNNWGTQCSYCLKEMPAMQEIYEKYGDKIEIVAVSNYIDSYGGDSDARIVNFYNDYGYTFPLLRDTNGLVSKFGLNAWPTTVVIDRYGAIARIETGAVMSAEAWERMINKYIGDDYVQTFTPGVPNESINNEVAKPDIELPETHYEDLAEAIQDASTFPEGTSIKWYGDKGEYSWPFLFGYVEGVSETEEEQVMYASNIGKVNTQAIIYATVNVDAGKLLTFDYYSDTEKDADVLYFVWDGRVIREISGNSKGWKTCYLYFDIAGGAHNLGISYIKDSDTDIGKDNVYIRNLRFIDFSDYSESADMLRGAAYGLPEANAKVFPYYADVEIKSDGYFHVNLSTLQNSDLAGNDASPLLLVNLMNVTPWSASWATSSNGTSYSISQLVLGVNAANEYAYDCTFTINDITRDYRADLVKYLSAAASSDIPGFVPVDEFLYEMLTQFMAKVSGDKSHSKEWLEACFFYSHYGEGKPIGNPIIGLMDVTAIPVEENTRTTADLTRNTFPFPSMIYTFTPDESAVYKIETLIPYDEYAQQYSQIWLYDDETTIDKPIVYCGDTYITLDAVNEYNAVIYRYMTAGHKYYIALAFQMQESGSLDFIITNEGQSVTVLTPCSDDIYDMVLDNKGEFTGKITLAGAIEYEKDKDGYYHASNSSADDDYIYLDFLHASTGALGTVPLYRLIDMKVTDPGTREKLDFTFFDFAHCTYFYSEYDSDGNEIVTYTPDVNISAYDPLKYSDYTEILRGYYEAAPTEGEHKGMVRVNQELVDILTLFIELRVNAIYGGVIEKADENEWLRFCWYDRSYNETTP